MKVQSWAIDRVKPYDKNPRDNAAAVDAVAKSIEQFGFRVPIVVDADGVIIAGHTRLKAATKLGLAHVPVHVAADLSADQARALRVADNKTGELATWNNDLLAIELKALEVAGFTLVDFGFSTADIDAIFAPPPNTGLVDADDVPPKPAKATTKLGDLWHLGRHRLVCGDSRDPAAVAKLLDGQRPGIMVTDPPYGVEYDPSWRAKAGLNKNRKKMGVVSNDDNADWTEAWALFTGDVAYVYHAGLFASVVQHSLEASGFEMRSQIVWAKDRMALSRGDYHWQHEPCWYAVRAGATGGRTDDRTQTTLWQIPAREDGGHGHGTQKPVECMERPIRNHNFDLVYDPFSGSGTTVIACERLGRTCFAMELDALYCDVIVQRWEKFTGKKAVRHGEEVQEGAGGPRARGATDDRKSRPRGGRRREHAA